MSPAPLAALLLVQVLFGAMPVIGKFALPAFGAGGVCVLRIGGAALAFGIARRVAGVAPITGRDRGLLVLCAVLGIAANQLLFLHGLARTSAAHAALVIATIPILTILAAAALGRERIGLRRGAGITLAGIGTAILVTGRSDGTGATVEGDLLVLGNAVVYAVYLVLSRDLLARWSPLAVLSGLFGWGLLLVFPFTGFPPVEAPPVAWAAVVFLIVGPTIGTYGLNLYALRSVPSSMVAIFIYLQPIVAVALAFPLLGEVPSARTLVSALVTMAGVAFATGR